ncbi:MAG TPA: hypothetical protein VMT30_07080 [Candidatus Saccharimonadia bacterium]|nr:hypothetical protein [Candidatus Saccharimonadia bacterium]
MSTRNPRRGRLGLSASALLLAGCAAIGNGGSVVTPSATPTPPPIKQAACGAQTRSAIEGQHLTLMMAKLCGRPLRNLHPVYNPVQRPGTPRGLSAHNCPTVNVKGTWKPALPTDQPYCFARIGGVPGFVYAAMFVNTGGDLDDAAVPEFFAELAPGAGGGMFLWLYPRRTGVVLQVSVPSSPLLDRDARRAEIHVWLPTSQGWVRSNTTPEFTDSRSLTTDDVNTVRRAFRAFLTVLGRQ